MYTSPGAPHSPLSTTKEEQKEHFLCVFGQLGEDHHCDPTLSLTQPKARCLFPQGAQWSSDMLLKWLVICIQTCLFNHAMNLLVIVNRETAVRLLVRIHLLWCTHILDRFSGFCQKTESRRLSSSAQLCSTVHWHTHTAHYRLKEVCAELRK